MSEQIRITPSDMRDRSTEYRNEASNIHDVIDKLDTLIARLQEEWEGKASQKFADQYTELKPSFQKMEELVITIASQLTNTAAAMEQMDLDIAGNFGVNK